MGDRIGIVIGLLYMYLSEAGGHVCAECIWFVFSNPFFREEAAALHMGEKFKFNGSEFIGYKGCKANGRSFPTTVP